MASALKEPSTRVRFEPWPEFLRRHWPAAPIGVLAAVVAFVAATVVFGDSSSADDEVDIRFGLTSEVNWPFYDPARDRIGRTLEDPAFLAEAEAAAGAAGGSLTAIDVDTESGVAFVDVTVRASSPEAATAVADLIAARVPEVDAEALTAAEQQDLDEAIAASAATEARLADYDARIAELLEIERQAMEILNQGFDPEAETTRLAAENERRGLAAETDEASRELSRQLGRIEERQAELDTVRNETEVLSVTAPDGGSDESRVVPLVAAVAAALAAMTASLWFTRRNARVTSAWQIRDGERLPLLGFTDGGSDAVIAAVAAQLRADAAEHPGRRTVTFTGDTDAPLPEVAAGVATQLRASGVEVEVGTDATAATGGAAATSILHFPVNHPSAPFLGAADRNIVVVRHGADRVADLRKVVDAVRDRGGDVDGVCVVS